MELIENDGGNALERRILLQHARQHALGHHLDARARGDARVETHAVADGAAGALAEGCCHARRDGTRGEPARLENDEPLTAHPVLREQRKRHHRALAGSRWRLQHGRLVGPQGFAKRRQRLLDRQGGTHQIGFCRLPPGPASMTAHAIAFPNPVCSRPLVRQRHTAQANSSQPPIHASPPSGVSTPNARGPPRASR